MTENIKINWKHPKAAQFYQESNRKLSPLNKGLWPISREYFSPIPALYLEQIISKKIAPQQQFLVRDGLLSSLWHIFTCQKKAYANALVFHKKVAPFVPKEYSAKNLFYEVVSTTQNSAVKNLIFVLVLSPLSPIEELTKKIKSVLNKYKAKRVYLYTKTVLSATDFSDNSYLNKLTHLISKHTKEISFIDYSFFEVHSNLKDFHYLEISDDLLYTDSYLQHHCFAKGAKSLLDSSTLKEVRLIELSPFHGIRIGHSASFQSKQLNPVELEGHLFAASLIEQKIDKTEFWPRGFVRFIKEQT